MTMPQVLIAALETAFNRYLSLDPDTLPKLGEMEGKVIAVDISGFGLALYLFPGIDGIMISDRYEGEADATLKGSPLALTRLGLAEDAAPILFSGEVTIEGDTQLGRQFKKMLAQLDIDWEELLARRIGDIAAHKVGNLARSFNTWQQRAANSLIQNVGEYLQEEVRQLPARNEVKHYLNQVDVLRDDTARLEARIARLENRTKN